MPQSDPHLGTSFEESVIGETREVGPPTTATIRARRARPNGSSAAPWAAQPRIWRGRNGPDKRFGAPTPNLAKVGAETGFSNDPYGGIWRARRSPRRLREAVWLAP